MDYTDLRVRMKVLYEGQPYEVTSAEFLRKQQRKAVVKTTLRNLITGRTLAKTFQPSDSVEKAYLEQKQCEYLYKDGDLFYFMDTTSYDQFPVDGSLLGEAKSYLSEASKVTIQYFDSKPIGVDLPPKMNLKVMDTPPGVRGNTATGGTKQATMETGLVVQVPFHVNIGDVIRINTETGSYEEIVTQA